MKLQQQLRAQLRARWEPLAAREKMLVGGTAGLVGLALVWWILFAPALAMLRSADAQDRKSVV